jgi:ankyrin repeat protein
LVSSDGHLKLLRLLLDFGAEVDVLNGDGATPLHLAAQDGHLEVVEALLNAGAEKDCRMNGTGATPLRLAAGVAHHHIVELLIRWGANKDLAADDGRTPLQVAALHGYSKVGASTYFNMLTSASIHWKSFNHDTLIC